MNYGAGENDYFQFTNPSMAFDKASGFTTLIEFGIHVNPDGALLIGGMICASNGVYTGPANWGSLVTTLKTPPTTVNRYEVLIGGWTDTSFDSIRGLVNSQGTGPGSVLYQNFKALKTAVPGIDAVNDDDEYTYDLASSTNFANMLGSLGYKFTLVPYMRQSFWVQLRNSLTNCDYVYLQCYEGGAGNDPGNWNAAFGGVNGFSLSGFHVIPGQESNTANPTNWTNWYLETGVQGGFYFPDILFNTTNWSAAIRNGAGPLPVTLTNNDTAGSSFNSVGNWSNGKLPGGTNAYVDSGFVLNTPPFGNQTFQGGSLLLNNSATLSLKNPGSITTFGTNAATGLTVDYAGSVTNAGANSACTLAGYLTLGPDGGGNFAAGSGQLDIAAVIGGQGTFNVPPGNSGVVVLSVANTFFGSTVIGGGATLQLQDPQSLAASQLTLNNGSTLQLRSDTSVVFEGGDNLQGLGHANVTIDVNQLTGAGIAQTLGLASAGFFVGDTTLNFTGGQGYALTLGPLTGAYADPLTLNATSANCTIAAVLGDANITQLVKLGGGTVFLAGANAYTGTTLVKAGALVFPTGASGMSSRLQIAADAGCQILTKMPVLASTAVVDITNGGNLFLAGGENLQAGSLILNGVVQPNNSWGSTRSSAVFQNDAYFSGAGVLWVGVAPPAPAAPTMVSAGPGDGKITLYWNSAAGATSYHVKRGSTIANQTTIATVAGNTYLDAGLTNGVTSYYAVSAVNSGGESANSAFIAIAPDAVVTLTNSDAYGVTSFNSGANWSDRQAPAAGKNYVSQGYTLRTPTSGNSTFAGNSLWLSTNGVLALKTGSGNTITVGSGPAAALVLDAGLVSIFDSGRTESLAGFITLNPGGGSFTPNNGTLPVASAIGGVGTLRVVGNANPPAPQNGAVVLSGNNTYCGGTVLDTADTLRLSGGGTLGAMTGAFTFSDSANLAHVETLDLNGTSQGIGNLAGPAVARIVNNAATTTSTLTVGNGDSGGGNYAGLILNGAGAMALTKVGAGTITLTGTNGFTGATAISGGVLALAGNGSINTSRTISIAPGAVLDVSARNDQTMTVLAGNSLVAGGSIAGNLSVLPGATVTFGNAIGSLTVQNSTWLSGTLVMKLDRAGTPAADELTGGTGIISGGGSLVVSNTGPALQPGDSFRLFNQPVSGFAVVSLPAGYVWANNLGGNGTIRVNSVIATNPVPLSAQLSGSDVLLQWPSDHIGWRLQSNPNLATTNWLDVAGSTATNWIIFPGPQTNASLFFRAIYP